jgi:hypothetical protein
LIPRAILPDIMRLIVSTMKDEGPFILEWIAHYLAIGFDHFIINSNDCSDGTDLILDRLAELGLVTHIRNPGPWPHGPQKAAYDNAMAHPVFAKADWVLVCDADEFLDIKVGDHTLDALFATAPDADVFAFVWQLFGHSGIVSFKDEFITEQMVMAANPRQIWPPQVRAIKSLVRMAGKYRAISTHRPKKLPRRMSGSVRWADGDGQPMHGFEYQGWMFTHAGTGFGDRVARMNHYAVRSIESYLVKRLRGDVNTTRPHEKLEQTGQHYWRLHCWNVVETHSIRATLPQRKARYDDLRSDAILNNLHLGAVRYYQQRIDAINKTQHAIEFKSLYENYKCAKVCLLEAEALSDPRMTINTNNFDPAKFLQVMQMARLDDMRVRRGAKRYPWFANMDALEIPDDHQTAIDIVAQHHQDTTKYDMLPPVPAELLAAIDAPWPARTPRAAKLSQQRNAFLDTVSGKKRGQWLLIGGSDPHVLDDLLARKEIETLFVIETWGLISKEMEVTKLKPDPGRKALDTLYFKTVLTHHAAIKSGRLRILRSFPHWVLRLFDDAVFDVVMINGARKPRATRELLDHITPKLRLGGLIVANSYRAGDPRGRATMAALHEFIAAAPIDWRIMASEFDHICLEYLPQQ